MTKEKLDEEIKELINWVEDHNGDVDVATFTDECNMLAWNAHEILGIRSFIGLFHQKGFLALDFADAVHGGRRSLLCGLAYKFPHLPGAKEYVQHYNLATSCSICDR